MKMNVGKFSLWLNSHLHHYNERKYWRMRSYVVRGGNPIEAMVSV